jgi:MFS family permease
MIAPIYIAEISAPEHRGKLVSVNQFNIVLGFSVSYFSNYYFLQLSKSDLAWVSQLGINEQVWRWMLGMEVIPALIWFGLLFTIPRSPRWLIMTGQKQEGHQVLTRLFGAKEADLQLATIQSSLANQQPPYWRD